MEWLKNVFSKIQEKTLRILQNANWWTTTTIITTRRGTWQEAATVPCLLDSARNTSPLSHPRDVLVKDLFSPCGRANASCRGRRRKSIVENKEEAPSHPSVLRHLAKSPCCVWCSQRQQRRLNLGRTPSTPSLFRLPAVARRLIGRLSYSASFYDSMAE